MKHRETSLLGSLQTRVMDVLWESQRPLKPREVRQRLGSGHAYTTVMTILKRLAERRLLRRKLKGRVFYYTPTADRREFVESNLRGIYGDLVDSYGRLAIAQFVDVVKTKREDMRLLREYMEGEK